VNIGTDKGAYRKGDAHMRVPVLPAGIGRLIQAINDEKMGYREIAKVIGESPSIALRILGLANSAWSAPREPISSLDMACGRLGMDVIRSVAMALAIAEVFNPAACPGFNPRTYWLSALLGAEAAAKLAEDVTELSENQARTAGLLRSIGLLWLADSQPDQTDRAFASRQEQAADDLELLLKRHCGLGYLEAGGMVARYWHLPEDVVEAAFMQCRFLNAESAALSECVCKGASIARQVLAVKEQDDLSGEDEPLPEMDEYLHAAYLDILSRLDRLEELADELCR